MSEGMEATDEVLDDLEQGMYCQKKKRLDDDMVPSTDLDVRARANCSRQVASKTTRGFREADD